MEAAKEKLLAGDDMVQNAKVNTKVNTINKPPPTPLPEPLPLWKLFRFLSWFDGFILFLASSLSAISGINIPVVILLIGYSISEFSDFIVARNFLSFQQQTNVTNNMVALNFFCDNTMFSSYLEYVNSPNMEQLFNDRNYNIAYGLLGVAVGYFVYLGLASFAWAIYSFHREKLIKEKLIRAALRQDEGYYDRHNIADIPNLLIDHVNKLTILPASMAELLEQGSSALVSLIIGLSVNWKLTLVVNSLTVFLFLILGVFGKMNVYSVQQTQSRFNAAASVAEQVLVSIKTVIAYSGEELEVARYKTELKSTWFYALMKSISTAIVFSIYIMVTFSIFSLGFWYGTELYTSCSGISVGDIIVVIFVTVQLNLAIGYMVLPLDNLNKAAISGAFIYAFIDEKPTILTQDDDNKFVIGSLSGEIELSDVVFSYPSRPSATVLHGVNLHIKPGQDIALIGPSGCGKSTILSLIARIYDANGGNILIDRNNIKHLSVKWLRNQIGIVSQEPSLFNVSIAENIACGKEGARRGEIEAAAEIANAHDFILDLPQGYDTLVGEGGSQISGGQKQRIAIARAVIKNPKILLLDEATSALDVKSEKLVQQALDKAREGRTTIRIAHRLSTIQNADVIVAMDSGRVVEMGTHRELMEKHGLYYNLVMEQATEETNGDDEDKEFNQAIRQTAHMNRTAPKLPKHAALKRKNSTKNSSTRKRLDSVSYNTRRQSMSLSPIPRGGQSSSTTSSPAWKGKAIRSSSQKKYELKPQEPLYSELFLLLKSYWLILAVGISFFILSGIQQASLYVLMTQTLNNFTEFDPATITSGVAQFVYLFAEFGALGAICYFIGTLALDIGSDRAANEIRCKFFKSILSQDAYFFDEEENTNSTLLSLLTKGTGYIAEVSGVPFGFVIRTIMVGISGVIVSLYASWALAFILLPSYVVLVVSWGLNNYTSQFFLSKMSSFTEQSNSIAVELIESFGTVNVLGIGDKMTAKCMKIFNKSYKYVVLKGIICSFFYTLARSSVIFVVAAAIAASTHVFLADSSGAIHASFDNIFLAISSVLFTGIVLKDAFTSLINLQNAKSAGSEIYRRLKSSYTIKDKGEVLEPFSADISATSLYFSYPTAPEVKVLNNTNFTIGPGQSFAFIGPSGSGKSTIISLIEKFYNPSSGYLMLGGKRVEDLDTSWLRQQIALVSQEPILFDMSIADNIRYGANFREVSDEEIQEAAKSANIHDFIVSLPKGYNTVAGLRGTQLSGGQKQRIAIARALVRNPKILLLDEATSALDMESERIVKEALDKAREGRTTIMISHRLSTIQNADCIAVLHRGRVKEHGTHTELMDKRGAYYAMKNNF